MQADVLIIGCGIAGATAALRLATDRQRRIVLLTRSDRPEDSNSAHAQGGIAVLGEDDEPGLLERDILRAGAGLSYPPAVRALAAEGPALLHRLLVEESGVVFDRASSGRPEFGLEGGHSRRRVLHVGDSTGRAVMRGLLEQVAATPNIELITSHTAVDLLTMPHHARDPLTVYAPSSCHGAYAFDRTTREVKTILAPYTVLATGGLGQIFLNTTNPAGARGDGLAMAYRTGARVINAEYVQFHPTAFHMPGTTKSLISEAVRGEGGVLIDHAGRPFMERHAPEGQDLSTRDVVARAIYAEMLASDQPYMLLDIASRRPAGFIKSRFPAIYSHCLEHNVDITRQPIPVVPAAHYFCGGVLVDLHGRTSLPGLYAVGEIACTGVHGANRLASTSLLEGLVWGARAAEDIRRQTERSRLSEPEVPPWDESGLSYDADPALIRGDMQTIRNVMWHYVGLLRNRHRLDRALRELRRLWLNIEDFYHRALLSDELIGLRNSILSAVIVTRAALQNPTSRGSHYREDSRTVAGAAPPNEVHPLEEPR
jgi:L-aspartate oxidase